MGRVNSSVVDRWLEKDNLFLLKCWCRDGLRDIDISERIGINVKTLYEWKNKYPAIKDAMSRGKEIIDYEVENALLKSALGYTTTETKTIINGKPDKDGNRTVRVEKVEKEYPPNVTAIAMWLNNRKPDDWKRNRDNIVSLKDEDSNITVNIIKHSTKEDNDGSDEWSVSTESIKSNKKNKNSNPIKKENDLDKWPDDLEE